jgi:sigma-B regulation protein RsbU (phosphoserine phosphatase)
MTGTELAGIFIGSTLLAVGVVSMAAASVRLRRSSTTLLTFGLWTALYGVRMFVRQPVVRDTIGGEAYIWTYVSIVITYAINIPILLFIESLVGPPWKRAVGWLVWAAVAFAIVAMAIGLATGNTQAATTANTWFVLASLALGLVSTVHGAVVHGMRTPLTDPIVLFGGTVLGLLVANENLGRNVVPGVNIEPLGVLLFVVCLGYAVGRSMFRAEADFAGVQKELARARQIQFSLLPREVPRSVELDVAVRYVPMTAVAGDIYDFIRIGPSSLGILVADVMGHGIPAALVASMVKLAFSVQADRARDPADVLSSMNRILCGQLDRSYVTAVYAVVDCERRTVTLANAGHPPALVTRRDGGVTRAVCDHGALMGFDPDARYTNVSVEPFQAGDRLLLYSDGVTEARNAAGEFFDDQRVARWLSEIDAATADGFAAIALDELTRWADHGRFDDDVTFVVAQVAR